MELTLMISQAIRRGGKITLPVPIFFLFFLLFVFFWQYNLRKSEKRRNELREEFWRKEAKSLVVRKKEINEDLYYRPNFDLILSSPLVEKCQATIDKSKDLKKKIKAFEGLKMLSFPSLSNADLRLKFGTANQTVVFEYEENYDIFQDYLYQYIILLFENDMLEEAQALMEEAIRLDVENTNIYIMLADLYEKKGDIKKVEELRKKANLLYTINKNKALKHIDLILENK